MSIQCVVWRSKKREGYYIFCQKEVDLLTVLPESLMTYFHPLEPFYDFRLTEKTRLQQGSAKDALKTLQEKKYYIQMPNNEDYVQ